MDYLIKKAQQGDKEAFAQAVTSYLSVMYKVAKTKLSTEEDIGDAIQEAILSAFKNLRALKNPGYFHTWLIRILINQCNDIIKQNSKVVCMGSYDENSILAEAAYEQEIDAEMDFNRVLAQLRPDYKTAVVLYYVNGFLQKMFETILRQMNTTCFTAYIVPAD